MKPTLLLFISVMFFPRSYAQLEIDQPDSVYRLNGVKTRIQVHEKSWINKIIYRYERAGRHIETLYLDSSAKRITSKVVFGYDSTNKLIYQCAFNYATLDTATQKIIFNEINPDTVLTKIEYDSLNRLSKKSYVQLAQQIYYEATYSYNPLTIKTKYTGISDTVINKETIMIFEMPGIAKSYFGYINNKDEKSKKYQHKGIGKSYANTFDKLGRLIKTIASDSELDITDHKQIVETIYAYNEQGLLIKKTTFANPKHHQATSVIIFNYEYW